MERLRENGLKIVSPKEQKFLLSGWDLLSGIIGFSVKPKVILGLGNIPSEPHLVVANHRGIAEPAALWCTWDRWIYFMAKHETFEIPVLGKLCEKAGMFPVRRGEVDRTAIRTAVNYLKEGQVVGIMPEGTRGRDDLTQLNQFKEGAALVAIMAGSIPIVPVAITGPENILALIDQQSIQKTWEEMVQIRTGKNKPELKLSIGEPIVNYPRDRETVTEMIFRSISNQIAIFR